MTTAPDAGFDGDAYGADYVGGRWVVRDAAPNTHRSVPYDPTGIEWGDIADAKPLYSHSSEVSTPLRELLYTLLDALPPIERECVVHGVLENHGSLEAAAAVIQWPGRAELGVNRRTLEKYRDQGIARMAELMEEPWVQALIADRLPDGGVPSHLGSRALFAQVLDSLGEAA